MPRKRCSVPTLRTAVCRVGPRTAQQRHVVVRLRVVDAKAQRHLRTGGESGSGSAGRVRTWPKAMAESKAFTLPEIQKRSLAVLDRRLRARARARARRRTRATCLRKGVPAVGTPAAAK
eukprot:4236172-Prymnesium_polylepis.1